MRITLFLLALFCFNLINAQECLPQKNKEKRLLSKIERLIKKRAYYDALDKLKGVRDLPIFYSLKSEILWRRGDYFSAEKAAINSIGICPDKKINPLFLMA